MEEMTAILTLIWLALYLQPSPDVLLQAIRLIESGGNLTALGDGGVSLSDKSFAWAPSDGRMAVTR